MVTEYSGAYEEQNGSTQEARVSWGRTTVRSICLLREQEESVELPATWNGAGSREQMWLDGVFWMSVEGNW